MPCPFPRCLKRLNLCLFQGTVASCWHWSPSTICPAITWQRRFATSWADSWMHWTAMLPACWDRVSACFQQGARWSDPFVRLHLEIVSHLILGPLHCELERMFSFVKTSLSWLLMCLFLRNSSGPFTGRLRWYFTGLLQNFVIWRLCFNIHTSLGGGEARMTHCSPGLSKRVRLIVSMPLQYCRVLKNLHFLQQSTNENFYTRFEVRSDVGSADGSRGDDVFAGRAEPLLPEIHVPLPAEHDHWHRSALAPSPHVSSRGRIREFGQNPIGRGLDGSKGLFLRGKERMSSHHNNNKPEFGLQHSLFALVGEFPKSVWPGESVWYGLCKMRMKILLGSGHQIYLVAAPSESFLQRKTKFWRIVHIEFQVHDEGKWESQENRSVGQPDFVPLLHRQGEQSFLHNTKTSFQWIRPLCFVSVTQSHDTTPPSNPPPPLHKARAWVGGGGLHNGDDMFMIAWGRLFLPRGLKSKDNLWCPFESWTRKDSRGDADCCVCNFAENPVSDVHGQRALLLDALPVLLHVWTARHLEGNAAFTLPNSSCCKITIHVLFANSVSLRKGKART